VKSTKLSSIFSGFKGNLPENKLGEIKKKTLKAEIKTPEGVKTKKCVLPFKHRDKIYNNCIKIKEKDEDAANVKLKCLVDVKGRNKFGTCIDQKEQFLTEKNDSSDKGDVYVDEEGNLKTYKQSNNNEIYKAEIEKEKKTKKKDRLTTKWKKLVGYDIVGDKIKEKDANDKETVKKYHSLEEAKKSANKINLEKGKILCDSIVQFNDAWFQLRKATQNKAVVFPTRNLFVLDSKKAIINSIVKHTKKSSSVKLSENTSDEIWDGPYVNYGVVKIPKSHQSPPQKTLKEVKELADTDEYDDSYEVILKEIGNRKGNLKTEYKLRKVSRIIKETGKTIWIRKTKKEEFKKKFNLEGL
jgi:uncharacterized protein YlxP (DUF503 family)